VDNTATQQQTCSETQLSSPKYPATPVCYAASMDGLDDGLVWNGSSSYSPSPPDAHGCTEMQNQALMSSYSYMILPCKFIQS